MKVICYVCLALSVIFVILFTSVELVSVMKPLYETQYEKNNVYEVEYVKNYPVSKVTDDVILYLADILDDMNQRGFFRDRENIHMTDVKTLFELGKIFRILSTKSPVWIIYSGLSFIIK